MIFKCPCTCTHVFLFRRLYSYSDAMCIYGTAPIHPLCDVDGAESHDLQLQSATCHAPTSRLGRLFEMSVYQDAGKLDHSS